MWTRGVVCSIYVIFISPEFFMVISFVGTKRGLIKEQLASIKLLLKVLKPDLVIHGMTTSMDIEFNTLCGELNIPRKGRPSYNLKHIKDCHMEFIVPPDELSLRNKQIANDGDILIIAHDINTEKTHSVDTCVLAIIKYTRIIGRPIYIIKRNGEILFENIAKGRLLSRSYYNAERKRK